MSNADIKYRFLNHIDAPKRYLSFMIDELVVLGIFCSLLIFCTHKITIATVGYVRFKVLRNLKKGAGPKHLLVLAYWYLPHSITQYFIPKLPASHLRLWVA